MEIHAPSGPTHSFKDFAIHILIVTVGILIAFSLEGAREAWRESKSVAEARENMTAELRTNQQHLTQEMMAVEKTNIELNGLIDHLPELAKTPAELRTEAMKVSLPGYFFRATGWDSALESGVLAHLPNEELHRFDEAYLAIKGYQELQKAVLPDLFAVTSYFGSHRTFSAGDLTAGEEKLRTLRTRTQMMEYVGQQFSASLKEALGKTRPNSEK